MSVKCDSRKTAQDKRDTHAPPLFRSNLSDGSWSIMGDLELGISILLKEHCIIFNAN